MVFMSELEPKSDADASEGIAPPVAGASKVPTSMPTATVRFALRTLSLLALAAGGAGVLKYEDWGGTDTFLCFGWAVACSLTLAVFGYRSLHRGVFSTSQNEAMKHLFGGMLLRLVILIGGHAIVFSVFGSEWGGRALISTTALYVLALAFEVFTVQGELKQAHAMRRAAAAQVPGNSSDRPESRPAF